LEFVKDFQQDIIADMEIITGVDLSKKSLPKTLTDETELKKKNILKENGSINVLGLENKPSIKDAKHKKINRKTIENSSSWYKTIVNKLDKEQEVLNSMMSSNRNSIEKELR
jgi:hypothetical protein